MRHYYLVRQGDYGSVYNSLEIEQLSKPIIDYWLRGGSWYGFQDDPEEEYIIEIDEHVQDTNSTDKPFILASLCFDGGVEKISDDLIFRSSSRSSYVWTCIAYLGTEKDWKEGLDKFAK